MHNRLIRMNNVRNFDTDNPPNQISFQGDNVHHLLSHEEREQLRARTGSSSNYGDDSF